MFEVTLEKYKEYDKKYVTCNYVKDNKLPCYGSPSTCMYAYNVMLDYREVGKNGYVVSYPIICTCNKKGVV